MHQTIGQPARDVARIAPQPRRPAAGLAAAVRDALSRRQSELPSAFLADAAIADVRREVERHAAAHWQRVETPLIRRWLAARRTTPAVRRVVDLFPSGAPGIMALFEGAADVAPVETYLAVDPSPERAAEATARVTAAHPDVSVHSLAADPSLMLPIRRVPGTVVSILAATLGRLTPVSAVRTLRAVRAAMSLEDVLLVGLDLRPPDARLADPVAPVALLTRWHAHALAVANRDAGTDFAVERFVYAARYDDEHRRVEEGIASLAACRVQVPGIEPLAFRRGELVRTMVQCCYDRQMLSSMLRGVGLFVDEWLEAAAATHALAVARVRFPDDGQP